METVQVTPSRTIGSSPKLNVLAAIRKGTRAVKLSFNQILQLTGGAS